MPKRDWIMDASSLTLVRTPAPMFTTPPPSFVSLAPASRFARTALLTCVKSRVCPPSPKMVGACPPTQRLMNAGMTAAYAESAAWRVPKMLK